MESTPSSKKAASIIVLFIIVALFAFVFLKEKFPSLKSEPKIPEISQEERKSMVDSVVAQSKPATSIDITGCRPSPAVASFKLDSKVQFKNTDNVLHTISFSPTFTFNVPAKTSVLVPFSIYKLPGIRKYTCDQIPVGSVVIE